MNSEVRSAASDKCTCMRFAAVRVHDADADCDWRTRVCTCKWTMDESGNVYHHDGCKYAAPGIPK